MKYLLLLTAFAISISIYAQDDDSIRITVLNDQNDPLPLATVELFKKDGVLVKIQLTDSAGKTEFDKLKVTDYTCRISHAGFTSYTISNISLAGDKHDVAPVILRLSGETLSNITVTARKPFIELQPGKTIVNLDASITSAGSTAMEALEKMPGITIDKDGNISLKGKAGVLVLMDGRPTYLDASQLVTLLNGMSASQISQVEIMSQPPAKYDAAGNAGLINIKTKKNLQKGFNGSVTASFAQGIYPKNNNNLQFNYRSGKWNLFANYGANFSTNFTQIYALRTYYKPDGSVASILEQLSFFKGKGVTHNIRAGVDYSVTNKTTIGVTATSLLLDKKGNNTNPSSWMNPQKVTDSALITQGTNNSNWKNAGANFNFKHSFTSSQELGADVDVIAYRIRGDQFFENLLTFPRTFSDATRAVLPSDIHIFAGKTDYSQQLKNVKFESGLKMSHITTDNLAAYEVRDGSLWKPDYNKSNHFLYTEDIQAAYANAETKMNKWSIQGGLRFEATSYDANQLGNVQRKDSSFSRSYNSFFPTFFTSYEADSNNSFSFSAGRRIDRPAFQKLNPFVFIINKYTYQKGNPFYRPQYTWNFELSHLYKNILITSIGYSITTDYFSQIFPIDSSGLIIYTEGNLGKLQHFTLSVSAQLSPASWWSLSSQAVLVHKEMEGVIDKKLQSSITQLNLNINNQFRFKKGWSAEITGFYTSSSQNDIQEFVDPAGQLSAGVAKNVLKNKGTIKLAVRDIFYTQWMKGNTFFPQATEYFKLTRDTRLAIISFTYRFGKAFKTNKRSEGSAKEEMQRVGNG